MTAQVVVLRWTIIGYLNPELAMLLKASASKQRLVASYPQSITAAQPMCLNATEWHAPEMLGDVVLDALECSKFLASFWDPMLSTQTVYLQTQALPERLAVFSLTTVTAKAADRARAEWRLSHMQTAKICTQEEPKWQVSPWGHQLSSHRQD